MATFAGRYDEPMLRRVNGRLGVATGITVRVYESNGTTVATLYTDRTKATTADNPVAVDASGNLEFFADPGTYVLSILESDAQVATNVVSVHADPAEPATGSVTSVNGATGAVVLDADDINDDATAHRFATAAQLAKLDGIETGATGDQTAAELLTAIKTVDGSGSGLDADLLDGLNSTAFALASDLGAYLPLDLSSLTASTAPDADDLVYVWLDGTARKVAVSDLVAFVLANPTLTGTVTVPDGALAIADTSGLQAALDAKADADGEYAVNTVATSGATETLTLAPAHRVTMDQSCTFTFPTPAAGHTFLLWLSGAFTPTFPASVDWNAGTPPTYATQSLYGFTTMDGGTTWIGTLVASAAA